MNECESKPEQGGEGMSLEVIDLCELALDVLEKQIRLARLGYAILRAQVLARQSAEGERAA